MRALLATDIMEECFTLTADEMQNLSNENKIRYGYGHRGLLEVKMV